MAKRERLNDEKVKATITKKPSLDIDYVDSRKR